MYIVRYSNYEGVPQYKAFSSLFDAKKLYDQACALVVLDEIQGAALFEVPECGDARKAVERVKTGKAKVFGCKTQKMMAADLDKFLNEALDDEFKKKFGIATDSNSRVSS